MRNMVQRIGHIEKNIGNTGETMGNMVKIGSGKSVGHVGKTMGNIG